jgi:hypothetical protein
MTRKMLDRCKPRSAQVTKRVLNCSKTNDLGDRWRCLTGQGAHGHGWLVCAVHEDQAQQTKNFSFFHKSKKEYLWLVGPAVGARHRKVEMARGGKRKYAANRASIPRNSHTQIPHRPPPTTHAHPPSQPHTPLQAAAATEREREASEGAQGGRYPSLCIRLFPVWSSPRRPKWYAILSVKKNLCILFFFWRKSVLNQFFILAVVYSTHLCIHCRR